MFTLKYEFDPFAVYSNFRNSDFIYHAKFGFTALTLYVFMNVIYLRLQSVKF